jgi:predicted nucleic acid-binding protein
MIYIDSWVFLEFFSQSPKWVKCGKVIRSREKKAVSTIVLMEIKYRGIKKFGIRKTREILHKIKSSESICIFDVTKEIAELAADLRIKYYDKENKPVSYADMINLATAIMTRCKILYSGDPDFTDIKEIKTVIV